jgi:predicted transcriptional regulator
MIDFACKQFKIDQVIKCSLGLTKAEYKIFEYLLKHQAGKISTTDLSKKTNLDLTTIQKSVKKLYEKGILIRTQKNMDGGGYVFCYQVKDKSEIKQTVLKTINSWVEKVDFEMREWNKK